MKTAPMDPIVSDVFSTYPEHICLKLMALRRLIFETAALTEGVGAITETLKWGEPAYLTSASKSGTTIRIAWKPSAPEHYAMYVPCQTNLVETFRTLFPEDFVFEGNRAIVFEESDVVPTDALAVCIEMALTYHGSKRQSSKRRAKKKPG